ncbi:MAG: hypothetical protein OFPII_33340 [Osedax symbiont Rs1]|nr:MAG: hypothetical protein OFPII_33340 [Osedax symbiont Rs1]
MSIEAYQSFDALTLTGIELLNKINSVIKEELVALTQRNLETIKLCATDKNLLLTEFSEHIQNRQALLKSIDYQSDKQSIKFFLNSCPAAKAKLVYQENWKKLEHALSSVIDANSINEQVLKRNQKNLDKILSILQGKQAHNILYDAKGDKGDYSGQSRIGKA